MTLLDFALLVSTCFLVLGLVLISALALGGLVIAIVDELADWRDRRRIAHHHKSHKP